MAFTDGSRHILSVYHNPRNPAEVNDGREKGSIPDGIIYECFVTDLNIILIIILCIILKCILTWLFKLALLAGIK